MNTPGSTVNPPASLVSSATCSGLCWAQLKFKHNPRTRYRKETWGFFVCPFPLGWLTTRVMSQARCNLSEILERQSRIPQ